MGKASFPLFAKPKHVLFTPSKIENSDYTHYLEEVSMDNTPISTGNFMQKIIDNNNDCGIKIYGYLVNRHTEAWKLLLTEILEQNPKEKIIEFHFYCGDDKKAFYFQAERGGNEILFSVMIGSDNDGAYHDVTYEDDDDNEYNIHELEDMSIEDSIKRLTEKEHQTMLVNYKFNEKKYRIVYNFFNVIFEPLQTPTRYL